jgi:hypothetical protein
MDMAHWRRLFPDEKYLGAWDLEEKPDGVVVVIDRVQVETLKSARGEDRKPVAYFRGKKKGMVLNKTNCKTIAQLYGENADAWKGQPIELFSTTVQAGGETVPCIRVRSRVPRQGAQRMPADEGRDDAGAELALTGEE